nr:MAG TPA: hypothetical protein [Caudoviricetes sp.]
MKIKCIMKQESGDGFSTLYHIPFYFCMFGLELYYSV